MKIEKLITLPDHERATVFLYLLAKGLPPWAQGEDMSLALVALTGWTKHRAEAALKRSVQAGYAEVVK
jgi:hypothetical protein